MGKAAAQLETVDEATPETSRNPDGKNQWKKVSGHDDLKPNRAISVSISNETAKRLRAITRAPSAIQDAYREGRISQTLAAKLGPKNPTPEKAAQVAEIAAGVRRLKNRRAVDSFVREQLGEPSRGAPARAMAIVRRMSPAELHAFEEQFNEFLQGRPRT